MDRGPAGRDPAAPSVTEGPTAVLTLGLPPTTPRLRTADRGWTAAYVDVMLNPVAGLAFRLSLLIGLAGCYSTMGTEPDEGDAADARPDGGEGDTGPEVPGEEDTVREVPGEGDAEIWMSDGDPCTVDRDCGDGDFCTGVELCLPGVGCAPGTPPNCDDGIACTRDSCDPAAGECRSIADDRLCLPSMMCVPVVGCCDRFMGCPWTCATDLDCDDGDPCDGVETCGPDGYCRAGPVPTEACNGLDDDCDGVTDEGCGIECCTNLVDDDGDGLVDCEDLDCIDDPACTPCREGPEICWDGCDNDLDCLTDEADSDCAVPPCFAWHCRPGPEICDNHCDDDRDGEIDCLDPDCATSGLCPPPGCTPTAAYEESCDDSFDNDCDGRTDGSDCVDCGYFPGADPILYPERCDNGVDDDVDALTDCADPDCTCWIGCSGVAWAPEDCDNGVDDDRDGRTDAADFDCPRACS